jgi:hypothetical protein
MARKIWYDEVRACRRRPKIPGLALGAGDPRIRGASTFVANLPSDALGLAALFRAEDEFERLALRCTRTRVATAIAGKNLHAVDAFRAFDTNRTGLVNCGELWGGLEWLGVSGLSADRIYELMRLLDRDNDGLLTLPEFRLAFMGGGDDEDYDIMAAKLDRRRSLAGAVASTVPSGGIVPKPIVELAVAREGAGNFALKAVSKATLTKVKVKAHLQTQFNYVWSSRGVGAHTECGVWAPNVSLGLHKANRHRLNLGHYAHKGLRDPARDTKQHRMTLEVTDLNVLRLKTSDSMATVVAKLFPPPLRWRQVWNTIGKRIDKHLYVWAAIPPSSDFVALGMVGTGDEKAPSTQDFHCVPRKWCRPITSPPRLIWDDAGTGGRDGAVWQAGSFGLMIATQGHNPPTSELLELASQRFMLGDDSCNVWLPPGLFGNPTDTIPENSESNDLIGK